MTSYIDLFRTYLKDFRNYKKKDFIYNQGDTPSHVYFLDSGLVGLYHTAITGKETFLRVFTPSSILGHRTALVKGEYHASAVALLDCKIFSLDLNKFYSILKDDTDINFRIINLLANDLESAELRISKIKEYSARSRIIEALLFLKFKYPEHTWSRKDIAQYSGTTIETVTREIKNLEEKKIIKKEGKKILLLKPIEASCLI